MVLSQKDESAPEWGLFSQDLSLGLSYDDLSGSIGSSPRSTLIIMGKYEKLSEQLVRKIPI